MDKAYCYNVKGYGAFWQRGANAVRVRRHLHSIGWWTWTRRERKRAADVGASDRLSLEEILHRIV